MGKVSWSKTGRAVLRSGVAAVCGSMAAACGAADGLEGERDTGSLEQALAPAGSDAQIVSHTIPSQLYPGERRLVSVTMRNTGAGSPANDWTTAYRLRSARGDFGWPHTFVPATVAVGAEHTFQFPITAPPASRSFTAGMLVETSFFGEQLSVPVDVSTSVTPRWGCTLVSSTLPDQVAPGASYYATVTVRNSGTDAWPATNMKLASRDAPVNFWGVTNTDLKTAVAPGATATFGIPLRAPATPGTYTFNREMRNYADVGDFRNYGFCVTKTISVTGISSLGATLTSQDFPATVGAGERYTASVTVQNTGSEAWAADGTYLLYSLNTPVTLWGRTQAPVATATASGASATFSLSLTAPSAPGTYRQKWQLRKVSGVNAGFFGPVIDVPVTVTAAAPSTHAVTVNVNECNLHAVVSRFGHPAPGIPGYVIDTCPSGQTCTYEAFHGEGVEVQCLQAGITFDKPVFSSIPASVNGTPVCSTSFDPEGVITCFLTETNQPFTVNVGWEHFE